MAEVSKMYVICIYETVITESLSYNVQTHSQEGFEAHWEKQTFVNHAIVFMVRGLVHKWKQPVGYILSSGPW